MSCAVDYTPWRQLVLASASTQRHAERQIADTRTCQSRGQDESTLRGFSTRALSFRASTEGNSISKHEEIAAQLPPFVPNEEPVSVVRPCACVIAEWAVMAAAAVWDAVSQQGHSCQRTHICWCHHRPGRWSMARAGEQSRSLAFA